MSRPTRDDRQHPSFANINQAFREKTTGGRRAQFKEIADRAQQLEDAGKQQVSMTDEEPKKDVAR